MKYSNRGLHSLVANYKVNYYIVNFRCYYLLLSTIVPIQSLAILLRDIFIDFVHLVLNKVAAGLINEVAALTKI